VVYAAEIQCRESRKLQTNGQRRLYFLAEAIPGLINIKFYHCTNIRGKYAAEFYNSLIANKDGHIPSPLIILTCIRLRQALLKWQMNNGVHPKASKSKLKLDRPDPSNYFNYMNNIGKNASCCAATGRKLLTLPGVAETYTFSINTCNVLLESYQQRLYKKLLLRSSVRSNRQRTSPLLWSSA